MVKTYLKYSSELRALIVSLLLIFLFFYAFFFISLPYIYNNLIQILVPFQADMYFFGIFDLLNFYFTVPAVLALFTTVPIGFYRFYLWVEDALLPHERYYIGTYVVLSAILFVVGVLISVQIVPRLVSLAEDLATMLHVHLIFSVRDIFNLWLSMAVGAGLLLQFPVLSSLLIHSGAVTKAQLRAARRVVYPLFYVSAAVITPGDLLVTDVLLFVIFVCLYELSIALTPTPEGKA